MNLQASVLVGTLGISIVAAGCGTDNAMPSGGGAGGFAGADASAGAAGTGGSAGVAGGSGGTAGAAGVAGAAGSAGSAGAAGDAGASGQFGTGTHVAPQYLADVDGAGATPPAPASGITAACPGDCATDATSCLQSAANDARDQDKALVIPAPSGTCYLITASVQVATSVVGIGYPLIQVQGATGDSDHAAFRVRSPNGAALWITGLRIDGGWDPTGMSAPGGEWSHGLNIVDSSNITIQDNEIRNTAGDSVYLGSNGTGENNIVIDGNSFVNAYRCNIAFIHADGVTVTNNVITKLNTYVGAIDFEPNHPDTGERVDNVELAGNDMSIPNGKPSDGCTNACTDFAVGASCSPNQGTPHGGSFFIHDNLVPAYAAANVTDGAGPGFASNNSSTWSGACASQWQTGTHPKGAGFYVWNNPPGSGTTNGNAP